MRNLSKVPIPHILNAKHEEWTAEYLSDPANPTKKFRYRDPEIKKTLIGETYSKCIYCESKVGHNTPGDVEHKCPSSAKPDLHFAWHNLSIACTECNRRKNDHWNEAAPFLDPYVDDVESVLIHLGPIVSWLPGSTRAEFTVRKLELEGSRLPLVMRKIEKIDEVNNLIERLANCDSEPLRQVLLQSLEEMKALKSEYSAMVMSVCKARETRG